MPQPLAPALAERVLEAFGLPDAPAADVEGLRTIYAAWCRNVPFDNIRKLIAVRGADDLPTPPPPWSCTEQQRWLENFTDNQAGGSAGADLVQDGWTDLSKRIRNRIMTLAPEARSVANMLAAYEDSDYEKMEEIRARVDAILEDPETAARLKAWYRQAAVQAAVFPRRVPDLQRAPQPHRGRPHHRRRDPPRPPARRRSGDFEGLTFR